MHVFLGHSRLGNVCYFSVSAVGASEESFSDFGDVYLETCVQYPLRKARGVHDPLERLEWVRYPLRSNEGVEANPLGHFEGVKTRTPSDPPPPHPGRSICNTALDNAGCHA